MLCTSFICYVHAPVHAPGIIVNTYMLSVCVNVCNTRLKIWQRKGHFLFNFGFQNSIKLNSQSSTEYVLCIMHELNNNVRDQI